MSEFPHAVIRADAAPAIGGGHVMRCLALAVALSDYHWQVTFAGTAETWATVSALAKSAYKSIKLAKADDADELLRALPKGCDLLVVDHYGLDAAYEHRFRPWARRIFVVDDLANRRHDCDILLDQTPGRAVDDYLSLAPAAQHLIGGQFGLLDRSFAELRRIAKPRS